MTDTVLPSYAYIAPDDAEHEINTPLARKVLEFLEGNIEHHAQRTWAAVVGLGVDEGYKLAPDEQLPLGACGTVGCFAGWAATLTGHTVLTGGALSGVVLDLSDIVYEKDVHGEVDIDFDESIVVSAAEWTRLALGLTHGQATMLFGGGNSRADLRRMLSDWTHGEIEAERPGV